MVDEFWGEVSEVEVFIDRAFGDIFLFGNVISWYSAFIELFISPCIGKGADNQSVVIVNAKDIKNPIANTIMATGGSGKERNLIYDEKMGKNIVELK